MKKPALICFFAVSYVAALEFGYMGNQAFGMGGSGVAVSNSHWATFYNTALQGINGNFKVGYSLGYRYKHRNISKLGNLNLGDIKDINYVNNILSDNHLKTISENGITINVPVRMSNNLSSSIGFGIYYTLFSDVRAIGNITNSGNGTISIDSSSVTLSTSKLNLLEIPLSYTLSINTIIGNFYMGVSGKYIYSDSGTSSSKLTSSTDIKNFLSKRRNNSNSVSTHTYGVDFGFAYATPMDYIIIGVVGKNLNTPQLNTPNNEKYNIDPQYRLGISSRIIPMTTIAIDFDLKPNFDFSGYGKADKESVQYISLGGMFNAGIFDLRLGVAKNIANSDSGFLISGGIGFTFIDISVFSSTKLSKSGSVKIPDEFGLKIGGGFSF